MSQQLPLTGVRVIEVCNVAAGPFSGMLLADMGADVIKVENPDGGDTLRSWPPITQGYSENFASLNRGKRSVTLNLKASADLALLIELVRDADVLIENNRPGVMERLGAGYDAMSKVNSRLLYCSISAYGQAGPRKNEGGFDLTIQAMSGLMSVTGEPGGAPVKCGVPVSDFAAGLYGAFSIAAALRAVASSGQGMHIDVSMLGATLGIAALQSSEYFGSGKDPRPLGSAHPRNAPYQVFRCKNGYFGMAAGNNALWRSVCDVVGRPDLLEDERFVSPSSRAANQDALLGILEEEFRRADIAAWLHRFSQAGVPCAPINSYSQVLQDPQVAYMGWVQPLELPNGVQTKTFGPPIRFSSQTLPVRHRPPALGEHNAQVLEPLRAAVRRASA
ncbi:CaiB/BaiF CoA transferase family protein [Candidimonas nitroreducens]|uniref:Carnitine dehydratase n=1 Tax=Candidimonas nitroreducens TaxID=683354 RepID=A0A225M7Y9_9BURK|nr:CoA transferase [Candidimonas nitroreducens]OWT56842.1 carnitine dehydratase [Candidimonas nitroreducens]